MFQIAVAVIGNTFLPAERTAPGHRGPLATGTSPMTEQCWITHTAADPLLGGRGSHTTPPFGPGLRVGVHLGTGWCS